MKINLMSVLNWDGWNKTDSYINICWWVFPKKAVNFSKKKILSSDLDLKPVSWFWARPKFLTWINQFLQALTLAWPTEPH